MNCDRIHSNAGHFWRSAAKRLNALGWSKLLLALALNLWLTVPYFVLQRWPLFPAVSLPGGSLENAIPFTPELAWLYLSIYLLVPIAPLLLDSPAELRRYSQGIRLIGLVSNLAFLLMPTQIIRPGPPNSANWLYDMVMSADGVTNACPSLHASLAVFSVLWLSRLITSCSLVLSGAWSRLALGDCYSLCDHRPAPACSPRSGSRRKSRRRSLCSCPGEVAEKGIPISSL